MAAANSSLLVETFRVRHLLGKTFVSQVMEHDL
jgi:hypothetical protein